MNKERNVYLISNRLLNLGESPLNLPCNYLEDILIDNRPEASGNSLGAERNSFIAIEEKKIRSKEIIKLESEKGITENVLFGFNSFFIEISVHGEKISSLVLNKVYGEYKWEIRHRYNNVIKQIYDKAKKTEPPLLMIDFNKIYRETKKSFGSKSVELLTKLLNSTLSMGFHLYSKGKVLITVCIKDELLNHLMCISYLDKHKTKNVLIRKSTSLDIYKERMYLRVVNMSKVGDVTTYVDFSYRIGTYLIEKIFKKPSNKSSSLHLLIRENNTYGEETIFNEIEKRLNNIGLVSQ